MARGFARLGLDRFEQRGAQQRPGWIDVYAFPVAGNTNAQTLTMTLQLATVLWRVPRWKRHCTVRVLAPLLLPNDDADEKHEQLASLLALLRIDARIAVLPLTTKQPFDQLPARAQADAFNGCGCCHALRLA